MRREVHTGPFSQILRFATGITGMPSSARFYWECLLTVASASYEFGLAPHEGVHVCDPVCISQLWAEPSRVVYRLSSGSDRQSRQVDRPIDRAVLFHSLISNRSDGRIVAKIPRKVDMSVALVAANCARLSTCGPAHKRDKGTSVESNQIPAGPAQNTPICSLLTHKPFCLTLLDAHYGFRSILNMLSANAMASTQAGTASLADSTT